MIMILHKMSIAKLDFWSDFKLTKRIQSFVSMGEFLWAPGRKKNKISEFTMQTSHEYKTICWHVCVVVIPPHIMLACSC